MLHLSPFSRRGAASLGVLLATLLGVARAQTPPPPQAPPAQAPEAVQLPARPTFQVQINLVTMDVIARDKNGQFVADLKADELELLEDGVKQDISSLTLVHGGRVYSIQSAPPPPAQEGIVLPAPRPTSDAAGRIFLLFVDDLHLDFRNTARIRELFTKISKILIHDGDLFGVVSTGPSSIAIDMTYDRKRLDEAIKKISGNGLKPSEIIEAPSGSEGPSEVRYRAQVAFSTARDILKNLERVQNRRKAVIYVSNGYDFNPFANQRAGNDPYGMRPAENIDTEDPLRRDGAQFADADLARDVSDLSREANRANASFYTIDPRGLVGSPDLDERVDPVEWGEYVRKSQDSLRVIADLTGGFAIVNQNDFDKGLKRIDAETSDYYMLGYYSSNPDPTRRTRRIEVKSKREGLIVWSRSSYTLKTPGTPTGQ
jgi:VWFA-related protein